MAERQLSTIDKQCASGHQLTKGEKPLAARYEIINAVSQ